VITNFAIDRSSVVPDTNLTMRWTSSWLTIATVVAWFAGASVNAAQEKRSWRDFVRQHGDTNISVELCGPITGLKEIVEFTQLTVEGRITLAEGQLTAKEDDVYTEYEIDVIRVFRAPRAARRSTLGPLNLSPFVMDPLSMRPNATTVRLRRPYHGRVELDNGVLTVNSGSPTLEVGQHIIVSAYFDETRGWWVPHGTFEVLGSGRVVHLDQKLQTEDYDSVEQFAAALANPPRTIHPSER